MQKNLNNHVQLIGRIGNEIEMKETASGGKIVNLSVATNHFYKDKTGEKVEQTTWHRVVAWNNTAELMSVLFNKGEQILIKGSLNSRSYDDKEGQKRYITEIVADQFLKLEAAKKQGDLPF